MLEFDQRRLLGDFVRAHREKLIPRGHGRRRSSGLKREELAERAGISTTWCAWIEQGRKIQASADVIDRLARGLELTRAERAYLFDLANRTDPDGELCPGIEDTPASLLAAVSTTPYPAYGLDRVWNACCWNSDAAAIFPHWLGENATERNMLRVAFLDPRARGIVEDWPDRALCVLEGFRLFCRDRLDDPDVRAMIDDLCERSALFAQGWRKEIPMPPLARTREYIIGGARKLRFRQFAFRPDDSPNYQLVTLLPH